MPVGSRVFRVGFPPHPWAWPSWERLANDRFSGRWDDLKLWAIFERSPGSEISPLLMEIWEEDEVDHEILAAFDLLGLKWQFG